MEVKDILVSALKAVADAGIPDDLREVAFSKAVDLLTGSTGHLTSATPPSGETVGFERPVPADTADGDVLQGIAARLGIDREGTLEVFDQVDGSIDITVAPSKLSDGMLPATQQLALLLAAGRQAAGVEERTLLSDIRTLCEDFKKLDTNNFSNAMKGMKDEFTFQGSGKARSVRVTRPGWAKATALVNQLIGGGES